MHHRFTAALLELDASGFRQRCVDEIAVVDPRQRSHPIPAVGFAQ